MFVLSLSDLLLLACFLIVVSLVVLWLLQRWSHKVWLSSDLWAVDRMSGHAFEEYLGSLFLALGYRVKIIGAKGSDYGGDLVIELNGVKTLVQAKRYRSNVGLSAVQEVAAAKVHYGCQHAMVVTNSMFTRAAYNLARTNGVELWDRKKLRRKMKASKAKPVG
jgi:restriction system protein